MKAVGSATLFGLVVVVLAGAGMEACVGDDASGVPLAAVADAAPEGSTSVPDGASPLDGAGLPPVGMGCTADPSRIDIPGNSVDEDCSGKADDEDVLCDGSLAESSSDAFDAARAMGICKKTTAGAAAWGIIDAHYVLPDGSAAPAASSPSWGILPSFGSNAPRAGQRLLALSSGAARAPDQPGYQAPVAGDNKGYAHGPPAGFPSIAACGGLPLAASRDGIALEVRLKVPSNATSFSFAHQFFTADYPDSVCSTFEDVYGVFLSPKPAGSPDGNVALDVNGSAITVGSAALMRSCASGVHNTMNFACSLGTAALTATGFETHAATGWLKTTVPVKGGDEITLRFAIWDSGDGSNDSTALFDDFAFSTASSSPPMSTVPQ
jgi:hypothetical protein